MKLVLRKLPIYGVCIQTHEVKRYEDPEEFFRDLDLKEEKTELSYLMENSEEPDSVEELSATASILS